MLKQAKLEFLRRTRTAGLFQLVESTSWRRNRLLILCYHGVSFRDEHLWNPGLYLSPATFEARLELLRDQKYEVLPLQEGVDRLYAGTLPPRSVCITFDDGGSNFSAVAYPILQRFHWPVTVYLATYYCGDQKPVFDVTASYLLWKGQGQKLDLTGILPDTGEVELTAETAPRIYRKLRKEMQQRKISAAEKDELAASLAQRLGIDYADIQKSRLFHVMSPQETSEMARAGVRFEMHTHRHRMPLDRSLFAREIHDNRREILAITGVEPKHFCYPSGEYAPEHLQWLREEGVASATTCEVGFADPGSDPMKLPRLLDTEIFSPVEVHGWLSGISAALPRRST